MISNNQTSIADRFGIYFHIPFCKQACHYCNFHFSTNLRLKDRVLAAMHKEIDLQKKYISNSSVTSIYFGGGTPSILATSEIKSLLNHVQSTFNCNSCQETTLEMNPDDASIEKMLQLREIGISRLSIGIQSFCDSVLKYLNRVHNATTAINGVKTARQAGFDNINIDLIYAIPAVTDEIWKTDLDTAMSLHPEHIAAYCLTIEPSTVFAHRVKTGKMHELPEDTVIRRYELLVETLNKHGYIHYEVSNFAKPNHFAIHNSNYWNHQHGYLGIGPGAHSYNGRDTRHFNIESNSSYVNSLENNTLPHTIDNLTKKDKINEYIMTSLRTNSGCDSDLLTNLYDYNMVQRSYQKIEKLVQRGIASLNGNTLTLNSKGLLLADRIARELFC